MKELCPDVYNWICEETRSYIPESIGIFKPIDSFEDSLNRLRNITIEGTAIVNNLGSIGFNSAIVMEELTQIGENITNGR